MGKIRKNVWVILSTTLFYGCAIHAPMSEMVMFNPKKGTENNYYAKVGFGLNSQIHYLDVKKLEEYADENFGDKRLAGSVNEETEIVPALGLGPIAFIDSSDTFSYSLSLLPALGADVTFKIKGDYYCSIGTTFAGGQQIIVQRRSLYSPNLGGSFGIFYDHLYEPLDKACTDCEVDSFEIDLTPDDKFYLNIIGLRGMLVGAFGRKNQAIAKINLKLGYIAAIRDPYFSTGVMIGIY